MNDNLEKELNEIESVEKQNQEHLKNIDSKTDELNELVNNINEKSVVDNKNIGNINNIVMNSNNTIQIQLQKEKTVVDLKKEIFDHRKLVRWTSFCSIMTIILIGLVFLFYWLFIYFNDYFRINWIINHQNWFNSQNSNHVIVINGDDIYFPDSINYNIYVNCGWLIFRPMFYLFSGLSVIFLLISWISNICFLSKFKNLRKLYLPFFIFSFVIPFLTWLYCMGLMAFVKYKNKINYCEWLREKNINKYNKKINHYKNCK